MSSEAYIKKGFCETQVKTIDDLLGVITEYYPHGRSRFHPQSLRVLRKGPRGSDSPKRGALHLAPSGCFCEFAELHLDLATIATGLLHDTVEDTSVTLEDIEKNFGEDVRHLVDGVTKISSDELSQHP